MGYNGNNAGKGACSPLDGIQDPGNLGTIIRLADWFGISHIVCSKDTADVFSPKTVQATMGALAHVKIHYTDLETFLQAQSAQAIPLYGTFLGGENLYEKTLSGNGILIMGNEGNGIRPAIEAFVNEKLYIPNYPEGRDTSESLNVAIATAVVCAEFRDAKGIPLKRYIWTEQPGVIFSVNAGQDPITCLKPIAGSEERTGTSTPS